MRELYKMMLVDDEEEVRIAIQAKMDWEHLGFRLVVDAENGEDALEKVEQYRPNVIMTDIRMPYMDGLELAKRVHESYPSIKIIIFSGFDDFEYAKEAIRVGVSEYILKPVNVEELTQILTSVRRKLDEEIASKRDIERLKRTYIASIPVIREQFLNGLILNRLAEDEIVWSLKEYDIDIDAANKYIVATLDITKVSDEDGIDQKLLPFSIKELVQECLDVYGRYAVFTSYPARQIVILSAIDTSNSLMGLLAVFRDICKECQRIFFTQVSIGVGHTYEKLGDTYISYRASIEALGYRHIVDGGDVIYIHDVEPLQAGMLTFDDIEGKNFISVIKFGTDEEIITTVEHIISTMESVKAHENQQQAYIISVVNTLIGLADTYQLSLQVLTKSSIDYIDLISRIKDTVGFREWLIEAGLNISRELRKQRESTSKEMIIQAKAYIQTHFTQTDLSLESVCKHLHVSIAYFSTMFKKETGQTYISFLTTLRLQKAIELLKTTEDKTYMIAEKVGYAEPNYFSYVFKKHFGMSPSKYRNHRNGEID